jgi:hypothetical protein
VLFTSRETDGVDLIAQAPTGQPRRLVTDGDEKQWPVMAPDGTLLYFRLPEDTTFELEVRRAEGTRVLFQGQRAVSSHKGALFGLGARVRCPRQGGCVLGVREGEEVRFCRIDLRAGALRDWFRAPLPKDARAVEGWGLSPDGAEVAMPLPDGRVRLFRDGQAERELEVRAGCHPYFVEWNAAQTGLFVSAICYQAAAYQLLYAGLDGRVTVLMQSQYAHLFSPIASPDGARLAFGFQPLDVNYFAYEP